MENAVLKQHAHPNTVLHCLYGYYNLGYSRKELARVYNKSETTLGNWIRVYESTGTFERAKTVADKKFSRDHREWLCDFYGKHPLAYLDEAQDAFMRAHHITISKSSVWRIIHEHGLTWKVLERRAMHIKEQDIFRFVEELAHIDWSHHNLVFLDEVSYRNITRQTAINKQSPATETSCNASIVPYQHSKKTLLVPAPCTIQGVQVGVESWSYTIVKCWQRYRQIRNETAFQGVARELCVCEPRAVPKGCGIHDYLP